MHRREQVLRSFLAFGGAFVFAMNAEVALHEFGHGLAIGALTGRSVRFVLHPFLPSATLWSPPDHVTALIDAAGPLLPVTLGVLVAAALWRNRSTSLGFLMLLGPLALVMEGISNLMQILLRSPGSDSMRIAAAGVSPALIGVLSALLLVLGSAAIVRIVPAFGLPRGAPFLRTLTALLAAPTYLALGTAYVAFLTPQPAARNLALTVFTVVLLAILALAHRGFSGVRDTPPWRALGWAAVGVNLIAGLAIVAVELALFRP